MNGLGLSVLGKKRIAGSANPVAPNGGSVQARGLSFYMTWSGPAECGPYFHVYESSDDLSYTKVTSSPILPKTFTSGDFAAGQTRYYKVSACRVNGSGETEQFLVGSNTIISAPPAAPVANDKNPLESGVLSVTFWSADASQLFMVGNGTPLATTSPYEATGLNDGVEYSFTARKTADAGSSWSAMSDVGSAVAKAAPATPSIDAVVNSDGACEVFFTAVPANGYKITRDGSPLVDMGMGMSGVNSSSDEGLDNGTTYEYRLIAYKYTTLESAPSAPVNGTPNG